MNSMLPLSRREFTGACLSSFLLSQSAPLFADVVPAISTVQTVLEKAVQDQEVAGAGAYVYDGKQNRLYEHVAGKADVASARAMSRDSIFWIASMTKPVTATAVMMLHDAGKLSVEDLVEKHLPEFKDLKQPDGSPAKLTIRHLLTHTSGLGEMSPEQARAAKTLADVIPHYLKQPVKFSPGSKWAYCQSSINTAARIVEVVSGQSFTDYLDQHLFQPLGMSDTTFYLSDAQMQRLATPYRRTEQGKLEATGNFILNGLNPTSRERFPAANGGLYSTAADYLQFCKMILNGGELAGKRYLKAEHVRLMTSLQTGELVTGFTPGNGWGIGWCVIREPQGVSAALSASSFGHGGAYGTQAWIDPIKQRVYLLLVQRANFKNSDASDLRRDFQNAANAQLG
jgi:CubicO group peptidase (beta-lactamase class C family)